MFFIHVDLVFFVKRVVKRVEKIKKVKKRDFILLLADILRTLFPHNV